MSMAGKYIIKNATVVSIDSNIGNVPNCDVVIEDGFISAVGPNLPHSSDHTVIDGTNAIVSPGFIDTHRHIWQTQLTAIGTDYVLSDYILDLRHIYGASYSAHDAYMGNYCGALASIDNGITYLIDHSHIINSPEHADAAVKGLKDAKIRATFCYAMYRNPPWDGSCMDHEREEKTPDWRLQDARRVRETLFQSNGPEDLVRFGFALSEPDLTPIDRLVHEIEQARAMGAAVITAHISIGKWDPGNCITRQLGQRKVLGPDMVLSHCNNLRDDEIDFVREYGVGTATTPDTELQMGMNHPIAFKAKDRNCTASLGVDVCCSAPADMFAQMRLLLQVQRHLEHEKGTGAPLKMSRMCAEVLEIATMGGAKAVGLEKVIGSITPGKRADLLITRCDSPRLIPAHDPVGTLVLFANGSDIDTVFINGEIVKSGGKLENVDWPKIREELRASVASVMERSKKAPMEDVEAARDVIVKAIDSRIRRPRKACGTCKGQKGGYRKQHVATPYVANDSQIRCTGERPSCKRCLRLKHTCIYSTPAHVRNHSKWRQASTSAVDEYASPAPTAARGARPTEVAQPANTQVPLPSVLLHQPALEERYLGIPKSLVFTLVETYYDNAHLLLHKRLLLESVRADTAQPHIVLGNAFDLLHIIGLGSETPQTQKSWKCEIRRRRFWACYLMHCHNGECLSLLKPVADTGNLALPWPEEDFDIGVTDYPRVTLNSNQSNGGIYTEVIKALTLWASVLSFIKSSGPCLSARVPAIHALDEKISDWWRRLPPDFRLTPSSIATAPQEALPKILLVNIVYHQSLCALHASIVPLFCWGEGDDSWSSARQLSAQIAYDHACAASTLIEVHTAEHLIILENEPKYIDARKLTSFKANAPQAQASILEFNAILRSKNDGYVKPGEEAVLRIEQDHSESGPPSRGSISNNHEDKAAQAAKTINDGRVTMYFSHFLDPPTVKSRSRPASRNHWSHSYTTIPSPPVCEEENPEGQLQQQPPHDLSATLRYQHTDLTLAENQTLDIFHPLLDPQMLELFPDGDLPDLSPFDTSPFNLDYFDFERLSSATSAVVGTETDAIVVNQSETMTSSGWGGAE
ncbi:uncharacterized protein Z518_07055 [Rhinocladiella mackenziei CBS 650.93]|uniref:Amidohydrolase-related domain-containing protein n=1 Tax=Rhinocladiella mackenziei CBS 650.93 TaxID=1442369 RepID=A0A0D2FNA4_9EURO|nr:uncharacterized protein Z518_07055 [Rhinocladiella mackenziei CBS 650.93]KIX03502.1 hypothetical protein Z518_07055 [Rhinocladiella mackenziei CBS 650.93]